MPPTNIQRILENSGLNTATKRQRIQSFIDGGGDINILEDNGNPALLNEIQYGTDETVNLLLDLGADVNILGKKKANALIYSAGFSKKLSFDTYKKIIDKTVNLNAINSEDNTALIEFSITNDNSNNKQDNNKATQVVEYLVQKGADPNIRGNLGYTALIVALMHDNFDSAIHIARAPTLELNSPQENGSSTYLINAIKKNAIEVARVLLDRGADPSSLTENRRTTPLIAAVGSDLYITPEERQDLIRLLLEKGANKNVYNSLRMFAYDIAELDDVGEELYSELKPTVILPPIEGNRRNTIYNLQPRYRNNNNNSVSTLTAHPPNNASQGAHSNNEWEEEEEENINNDNVYPVGEEAKQITSGILSTPATPREERIQVQLTAGQTITVYDPIEASNVEVTKQEVEEDTENMYFKVGTTYSRLPIESINKYLNNFSAIQFGCKREMVLDRDGTPKVEDVHLDKPYYLISTIGKYLVPLGEIIWALSASPLRVFELVETNTNIPHVSSFSAIQKPYQQGNSRILNYSGRKYNIVSKDHCTPGTQRRVYSLTPIEFVATTGGRRKQTKKHRKKSKAKTLKKRRRILFTRRHQRANRKQGQARKTKRY